MTERTNRRGRISITSLVGVLTMIALAVLGYTFAPYYWHYMKMKEVTKSAALEWDSWNNQERGEQRLEMEFRNREIPEYIWVQDCRFRETRRISSVTCKWEVDVFYPFTDYYRTLSFETEASFDEVGLIK